MSWETFCDNARRMADRAADKINQTADMAALQVKLSVAQGKLKDAYAELGRVAYRHLSKEESIAEEVSSAMKEVEKCRKACRELQDKIAEQKAANAKEEPASSAEEPDRAD